jgi:hypothetical protein
MAGLWVRAAPGAATGAPGLLGWIERTPSSRAVRLSDPGRRGLRAHFQIEI